MPNQPNDRAPSGLAVAILAVALARALRNELPSFPQDLAADVEKAYQEVKDNPNMTTGDLETLDWTLEMLKSLE